MNVTFTENEDCAVASEDAITGFEQEHQLLLPADYRQFLLSSPGGSPSQCLSTFEGGGDFVACVYGIHNGAEEFGHDLAIFLPVAVSNGGNFFLLRLHEPDRGAVYFWDHELEDSQPPTFESLIRVSNSFSAWLDSLQEPDDSR